MTRVLDRFERKAPREGLGGEVNHLPSQLVQQESLTTSEQQDQHVGDRGAQQQDSDAMQEAQPVADLPHMAVPEQTLISSSMPSSVPPIVFTTNGFSVLGASSDMDTLVDPSSTTLGADPISRNE